ncbi:glycerophosphodiester phosphodiesterase [Bacillus sp. FSL K6-3431]|uniref:glycerophosphodiester phosphodiesterase n=1 Tax=Bacillus sp. FSL K6-3431 TaxID=2921500 RepID=UPI0030F9442D
MTLIIAHRGSAGTHPENTMDAFIAAERFGADGIELDVHLTSDGQLAVIHDDTLDRTTNGTGNVRDFSMQELRKLKANYHYKHFFKRASKIPSLQEVFEWLGENKLICNVELKNVNIRYVGLEEKVVEHIRDFGYENRIIISTFNHDSLVYVNRIAPDIETAPLYKDLKYKPWEYAESIHASGVHPRFTAITPALIKDTIKNGMAVRLYTVNKERDMKKFMETNCTAIITDYPEKALKIRNEKK